MSPDPSLVSLRGMKRCALAAVLAGLLSPARAQLHSSSTRSISGMALIPAGTFWMGSPEGVGGSDEHPRHKVHLDAFHIDRHEVTSGQYREFCRATGRPMPGQRPRQGPNHPVGNVDWDGARAYCEWAGKRLPTEAEWEKAARGGTDTLYSCGDDASGLGRYAWFIDNASDQIHPVGSKKPNQFGLYDMAGNVWEWVADWYDKDYYRTSPKSDPKGPASGSQHARRGGCWDNDAYRCRPASRVRLSSVRWAGNWGFRCARSGAARDSP